MPSWNFGALLIVSLNLLAGLYTAEDITESKKLFYVN